MSRPTGRIDTSIPPRDRTPCRCYASSFRHMIPVYAYSLSCSVIGKQSLRRRRDASPAHVCAIGRPGGDGGDGNCSGWDVMFRWSDATSLHVCIYLYCTQQSTKLFEDSQPRNRRETTIDFFFCGGSANPQTDPNTRASHQSRHYSSHTTQLNQTQSRTILSLPTTTAADTPAQLQWLTATTN